MQSLIQNRKPITVVDSIMGSGKTSWAIQYINESNDRRKIMFVTPYLDEVNRIKDSTNKDVVEPKCDDGKLNHLKELVRQGKNIACSHELLKRTDSELIELLDAEHYTLILDEVMEVIKEVKMSSDDIRLLLNSKDDKGNPTISLDSKGKVQWNNPDYLNGSYEEIRNLANAGRLMLHEEKKILKMYWLFPPQLFKAFEEIFILTYMFNGQIQSYYYNLFNLEYEFRSIKYSEDKSYQLVNYVTPADEDRKHLKELITIHYSTPRDKNDLNLIGDNPSALSKNHLLEVQTKHHLKKKYKDNGYNFYFHKAKVKPAQVIWTTFKAMKNPLLIKGLKNRFVAVNARATNDYADANTCIYFANRYMNPIIKRFFRDKGIKVNEDLFALSEMLQWIFRSAIRNDEPITVYIPSKRMRKLLEMYLDNQI
ncbi:hypothetical protein JFL43_21890 [Viridibacillus sp. YIM B01967]|uniref:Helicase/UvrB N-terminal domain-containing protein n=1 Tax=Viridibacillus soli TaxID=2798301 RepID=A0ABS1HDT6_9BACL|nr:hypothetical protein [Viridibacillus soli]MBK3497414.1 hypothetical protein [Viridibacillus soli]